jgi:BirA family biotin operon repressor/biotin-[acetyl-CoA-carboxylase] ligase
MREPKAYPPLTPQAVEEAARAAGIDAPVQFVPVTGSTNSDLLGLAEAGAPEWTLVVAGHLTAGRGRLGRTWVTVPGASLPVSVLLRPAVDPSETPMLSLAAAVAMVDACLEACRVEITCRWPNDLMAGGRKVGGILAEGSVRGTTMAYVVIGTGVNVAQRGEDFPEEIRGTATSIFLEGGSPDFEGLLGRYLVELRRLYGTGGRGLGSRVVDRYRERCDTIGRDVGAITMTGHHIQGEAVGVGERGELLIQTVSGIRAVSFGEIQHME